MSRRSHCTDDADFCKTGASIDKNFADSMEEPTFHAWPADYIICLPVQLKGQIPTTTLKVQIQHAGLARYYLAEGTFQDPGEKKGDMIFCGYIRIS